MVNSEIVVTDLTRFRKRTIVCVAGLERKSGTCVRPLLAERPHYLPYDFVKKNNVQPGSILYGDFRSKKAPHPHTEDYLANIREVRPQVSGEEFERLLTKSAVTRLQDGFKAIPVNRVFEVGKPPPVSIVTLLLKSPASQIRIVPDRFDDSKIKAHVTDATGFELSWMAITDLGFYDHVSALKRKDPNLADLNAFLHKQKLVLVRVGLSRSFEQSAERKGYWVQANGIYSFPNYRTDLRSYD